jgi:cytoskeletal protein CcmA (bactofilin family)
MRTRRLFGVSILLALAVGPLLPVLGSVRTSGRVIVTEGDTVREDLYAFGGRVIVEGTVEGDIVTFTNDLTITGTVTGDVLGAVAGPARISGDIGGSVRVAAVSLEVTGRVGGDVSSVAIDAVVAAQVARDVLVLGGDVVAGGVIGRDVRGQFWSLDVHGEIGRDVIVKVDDIVVGPAARVGGDVEFQASDAVRIDDAASVGGAVVQRDVLAPVWAKATTRVIAWLSILAFVFGGLVMVWLFRGSMARAVVAAQERPWRSGLVGLGVVLAVPVAVLPLGLTLVGLPVALVLIVLWVVALGLGAAPAVAAVGTRIMGERGGLAGSFLVGAVLWRAAMWVLTLVAALVYLIATLVGIGAFTLGAWEQRRLSMEDWRPAAPLR